MSKTFVNFPASLHDFNKRNNASDHVFVTVGPSLTRQEFAEECDINALMSRYDAHVIGGPGNMSPGAPFYADFAQLPTTLLEYMDFMTMAEEQFMRLPAVVRREFDNSPHMFVEFASNPANIEQMRSWGLAEPAKVPPAPPAAQSSPAPAGAAPASAGASTHGPT